MERREVAGGEKTETGRLTKQAASFFFFLTLHGKIKENGAIRS